MRRVKIEGIKTEPEGGSRVAKIKNKIKSERMDISEDRGKTKRKDRRSGSSKSTGKNRDASSGEDLSKKEEHEDARTVRGNQEMGERRAKKRATQRATNAKLDTEAKVKREKGNAR